MKKNSKLRIVIETEVFDRIKNQAKENEVSISEFCRQKLREPFPLQRIESRLEDLSKFIYSIKFNTGGKKW